MMCVSVISDSINATLQDFPLLFPPGFGSPGQPADRDPHFFGTWYGPGDAAQFVTEERVKELGGDKCNL